MAYIRDRGITRIAWAGLLGLALVACDEGSVGDEGSGGGCGGGKCDEASDAAAQAEHAAAVEACGELQSDDEDAIDEHMNCVGGANEVFALAMGEGGHDGALELLSGYRQVRFQLCGAVATLGGEAEDIDVMYCAAISELDVAQLIDAHARPDAGAADSTEAQNIQHLADCFEQRGSGDESAEAMAGLLSCLEQARFDYEDEHIVSALQEADPGVNPSQLAEIWDMLTTGATQSTDGLCGMLTQARADEDPVSLEACRRDAEVALSRLYVTFVGQTREN